MGGPSENCTSNSTIYLECSLNLQSTKLERWEEKQHCLHRPGPGEGFRGYPGDRFGSEPGKKAVCGNRLNPGFAHSGQWATGLCPGESLEETSRGWRALALGVQSPRMQTRRAMCSWEGPCRPGSFYYSWHKAQDTEASHWTWLSLILINHSVGAWTTFWKPNSIILLLFACWDFTWVRDQWGYMKVPAVLW